MESCSCRHVQVVFPCISFVLAGADRSNVFGYHKSSCCFPTDEGSQVFFPPTGSQNAQLPFGLSTWLNNDQRLQQSQTAAVSKATLRQQTERLSQRVGI